MGVGWIQQFYNDTNATWYIRSIDAVHNGVVGGVSLDDGALHPFPGPHNYSADWCGVPWYDNGHHYKDLTCQPHDPNGRILRLFALNDSIVFLDGRSGVKIGEESTTSGDYNITLSITTGGIYFDLDTTIPIYSIYDPNGPNAYQTDRQVFGQLLLSTAGG